MSEEIKEIGRRKYEALKSFDLDDMSEGNLEAFNSQFSISIGEAIKQIQKYEENSALFTPEQIKKNKEYFKKIREGEAKIKAKVLTKETLWRMFTEAFYKNEGVRFDSKKEGAVDNIKALIYYFLGDYENFIKCDSLSNLSKPNLKKGLLIIGGYGNGKTSYLRAFETCFKGSNMAFRGYTTNKIVSMYEACSTPLDKDEFYKTMNNGIRYFDDVMTERDASNYGKANLLKDIIEERYNKKLRTHISLNYEKENPNNLDIGLSQISDKYGDRIYDRLFDMFNIIEFKGLSYRE